ncbi:hypothetical protein EV426DRAFT_574019 [Tirmania nivea]|nr:hypothetical protein EV426DRAFT_574019 [Tirmania nivea]
MELGSYALRVTYPSTYHHHCCFLTSTLSISTLATVLVPSLDPAHFTQETDSTTIAQFLGQLTAHPANCFTIHPRVVALKSEANKQYHIARQTTPAGVAEYQGCGRIQALKRSLRATGTIVWMSGSQFHIGDKGSSDS